MSVSFSSDASRSWDDKAYVKLLPCGHAFQGICDTSEVTNLVTCYECGQPVTNRLIFGQKHPWQQPPPPAPSQPSTLDNARAAMEDDRRPTAKEFSNMQQNVHFLRKQLFEKGKLVKEANRKTNAVEQALKKEKNELKWFKQMNFKISQDLQKCKKELEESKSNETAKSVVHGIKSGESVKIELQLKFV